MFIRHIAVCTKAPVSCSTCPAGSALSELDANEQPLLAYVGYTSGNSVQQRQDLDGYRANVFMHPLWQRAKPYKLVIFKRAPQATGVLELMEYVLIELLRTHGRGFNLRPGGGVSMEWLSYEECAEIVQAKQFKSMQEFYS